MTKEIHSRKEAENEIARLNCLIADSQNKIVELQNMIELNKYLENWR